MQKLLSLARITAQKLKLSLQYKWIAFKKQERDYDEKLCN